MTDVPSQPFFLLLAPVLTALFVVTGCKSSLLVEATGPSTDRIARLRNKVEAHPDSAALQRDIGALYVRDGQPDKARRVLAKARKQLPSDPKVLFYLGLAREQAGSDEKALKLFRKYTDVPESSRFRQLMRGRFELVRRQMARVDIQDRIDRDTTGAPLTVTGDAIAPIPLAYRGDNPKYKPLGRGIAELLLGNLANIDQLTVVERIRLQALRQELKLSRSRFVDPSTAPRVGRLIGASRLIGGSYDVSGQDRIQMSVRITDIRSGKVSPGRLQPSASLSELFALVNDITFQIVDRLGIELTAQERTAIESVPTRNLEAFLAYSRALEDEDRGRYQQAATHYRRAAQADPSFKQAVKGASRATAIEKASGSVAEAARAGAVSAQALNLKQLRRQNLGIGGRLAGGNRGRQPAAEATGATLSAPPEIPDRQNDGS